MSANVSLSDIPFFAGLSPSECTAIEARMQRREFAPQAVIVRERSQGDAAYLVLSGLVAVMRRDPSVGVKFLLSELIQELQLTEDFAEIQETKQDLMSASEDAPIVRLSNSMLGLAIKQGASDIHIEPMESDVTIRFRIDGVLEVVQRLPRSRRTQCLSATSNTA